LAIEVKAAFVPLLQQRGFFHREYSGTTLRDHLDLPRARQQPGTTPFCQRTERDAIMTATPVISDTETVPYEELAARFSPIFDRIAAGAADRENARAIAYEEVGWLRDAGFGMVRLPRELGGSGASISQLFRLLFELGEADSNLSQGLRAHFGFVETQLLAPDSPQRTKWLKLVADGALFGNATNESLTSKPGRFDTEFTGNGPTYLLNGTKYYSTGTLYADWISVTARRGEDEVGQVVVSATAPGVERLDDFGGFGQRLTASGTTKFHDVEVVADEITWNRERKHDYTFAFVSLVLTATQVGIARAVVRDTVEYVRTRRRVYTHGSADVPKDDPLIQQVIGRLSAWAYAAEQATLGAVATLEEINAWRAAGEVPDDAFTRMDRATAQAYITVSEIVPRLATLLFDVGGASAVAQDRRLDRHWRNSRTVAGHNPAIFKERVLGGHLLNGTPPAVAWSIRSIPE
jgi:alkylation response protein AidB-like acyl-CoA dehydrogenase